MPAASGAFSVKQTLRSEAKQLDAIQAEIKRDKAVLDTLDRRTSRISDSVGVGRVSFGRNTMYGLVVGIYQCAVVGCTPP